MRWTDAQRTMLREMGLRLWLPGTDAAAVEPATGPSGRVGEVVAPAHPVPNPLPVKAVVVPASIVSVTVAPAQLRASGRGRSDGRSSGSGMSR